MDVSLQVPTESEHEHSPGKLSLLQWAALLLGGCALAMLIYPSFTGDHGHHEAGGAHAHPPSMWAVLPFVGMLLSIAVLPLMSKTEHWWENNKNRLMVALSFGAMTLAYYWITSGADKVVTVLEHAVLAEYIPFIVLLFALYVISGGICLKGEALGLAVILELPQGRPRGTPGHQHRFSRCRCVDCQLHRDNRRQHVVDPPAPADELRTKARYAHGDLLHFLSE